MTNWPVWGVFLGADGVVAVVIVVVLSTSKTEDEEKNHEYSNFPMSPTEVFWDSQRPDLFFSSRHTVWTHSAHQTPAPLHCPPPLSHFLPPQMTQRDSWWLLLRLRLNLLIRRQKSFISVLYLTSGTKRVSHKQNTMISIQPVTSYKEKYPKNPQSQEFRKIKLHK